MEVWLRPAGEPDVPGVVRLVRDAYSRYVPRVGREPAPMTADYRAAVADGAVWVAQAGGRVVGVLVVRPAADHLLLENIAVSPSRQGAGVGARLLALAERLARQHALAEIRLYTNAAMTENLAYYPRHGYRQTGRATQDGFERVFFAKSLTPAD